MARTRSTKAAPAKKTETGNEEFAKGRYALPQESDQPSKVFILPTKATEAARIVTLPNPRYSKPTKYLVCPDAGLFEFTQIAAPKAVPRSWLIESQRSVTEPQDAEDNNASSIGAQITKNADLFVATPIDPLFLMLPALIGPTATKKDDQNRLFLSSEDHFDFMSELSTSHFSEILRCEKTKALFEARMEAICDVVDAGNEKMFRINNKKLVAQILSKARAMSTPALPASLEDKFVKKTLEAPLSAQRSSAVKTEPKKTAPADSPAYRVESADSQASTNTVESKASLVSEASTSATSVEGETAEDAVSSSMKASEEVVALQRLRVAFKFICSSYVEPAITLRLEAHLEGPSTSTVDFAPLDAYLKELAKLRAEAASRTMADYSRKRLLDDEEDEARTEKKRKVEEEKKRKATQSRGVRDLKKVNTTGMKKMSDFFKKK